MNKFKRKQLSALLKTPSAWEKRFKEAKKEGVSYFNDEGNNFVLVTEAQYEEMKAQIKSLQDSTTALLNTLSSTVDVLPSPLRDKTQEDDELVKNFINTKK